MTVKVHTCIVGGGPAGLMLGRLLAKRGVDVLVLEGHETFDREFRGEVLQPSTAQLLDELGLLDYIQREPHSASAGDRADTVEARLGWSYAWHAHGPPPAPSSWTPWRSTRSTSCASGRCCSTEWPTASVSSTSSRG